MDGAKRLLTPEKGLDAPPAAGAAAAAGAEVAAPPAIASRPPPPLTVVSLSLRTAIHPTSHQHEVTRRDACTPRCVGSVLHRASRSIDPCLPDPPTFPSPTSTVAGDTSDTSDTCPRPRQVIAASVVAVSGVSPEAPMAADEWSTPKRLRAFSLVRRPDGAAWPPGEEGRGRGAVGGARRGW